MRQMLKAAGWALALLAGAGPALAQTPVAVVEEVRGRALGVEFMDYVAAGRVIRLGAGDLLVLGYMSSCWRETISGGTVTVGTEHSVVQQGRVERIKVNCATRRPQLGAREATQSAATVFRSAGGGPPAAAVPPPVVQGRSPVIEVGAERGRMLLERIDLVGERLEVEVAGTGLLRGRFLDLAQAQVTLSPGGRYRATLGRRSLVFELAFEPPPEPAPLLGRLLRFE